MRWIVLVLLASTLAGCAESQSSVDHTDQDAAGPATQGGDTAAMAGDATGDVLVVVVTPEIEPIHGATVALQGFQEHTAADGSVRFDDVAVGEWPVEVDAPGHRAALVLADIQADQTARVEVKLLAGEGEAGRAGNQTYQETYRLDGFFDCSATYLIITGDCMTIVDYALVNATGACAPVCPGDFTNEKFTLDVPLDAGWQTVVAEMHWDAGSTAGDKMTFAVEPAEWDEEGHAPKYAVTNGVSPLVLRLENGVPHETESFSADGDEPGMPQSTGGEVLRTRSFVQGEFHRPGGTEFLGVGAAWQQSFDVIVTVFYGEVAPAGYTAG